MASNHISIALDTGQPPSTALERLREIDPTLDLHRLTPSRWIVGSVQPNQKRRKLATGMLARSSVRRQNPQTTIAMLALEGFAPIATYDVKRGQFGHIVRDVAERDWRYRHQADETFETKLAASSNWRGRGDAEMLDQVEARMADEKHRLFRNRTFPYMGVTA